MNEDKHTRINPDRIARFLETLDFNPRNTLLITELPIAPGNDVKHISMEDVYGPASLAGHARAVREVARDLGERIAVIGVGPNLERQAKAFAQVLDTYMRKGDLTQIVPPERWLYVNQTLTIHGNQLRHLDAQGTWSQPIALPPHTLPNPAHDRFADVRIHDTPTWQAHLEPDRPGVSILSKAADFDLALRVLGHLRADPLNTSALSRIATYGNNKNQMFAAQLIYVTAATDPVIGDAILKGFQSAPPEARPGLAGFAAAHAAFTGKGQDNTHYLLGYAKHAPLLNENDAIPAALIAAASGDKNLLAGAKAHLDSLAKDLITERENIKTTLNQKRDHTPPPTTPKR